MHFPRAARLTFFLAVAISSFSLHTETWQPPSGKYEKLRECTLVDSTANDGDSFMVRQGGRSFLFRLYSVDTIETTENYPDRLAAQARHFGITTERALKSGKEAEQFVRRLLVKPFTIETCWQDAKGASEVPRFYAIITLSDGRDLAEQLAGAGLARVYGWNPTTPGFSLAKLQSLERQARTRKLGAYGNGVAPTLKSTPTNSAAALAQSLFARPSPEPVSGFGDKLDLNTATEEQLLAVPGVGPHFAKLLISGRPYEKVEDMTRVSGIGPKTFAKLAPFFVIGPK